MSEDYETVTITMPRDTLAACNAHAARLHINLEMFVTYALIRYMDERGYIEIAKAVVEAERETSA